VARSLQSLKPWLKEKLGYYIDVGNDVKTLIAPSEAFLPPQSTMSAKTSKSLTGNIITGLIALACLIMRAQGKSDRRKKEDGILPCNL
jgi:hypothetical protein